MKMCKPQKCVAESQFESNNNNKKKLMFTREEREERGMTRCVTKERGGGRSFHPLTSRSFKKKNCL